MYALTLALFIDRYYVLTIIIKCHTHITTFLYHAELISFLICVVTLQREETLMSMDITILPLKLRVEGQRISCGYV